MDTASNLAKILEGLYGPGGWADRLTASSRYAPRYPAFTPSAWRDKEPQTPPPDDWIGRLFVAATPAPKPPSGG